MTAVAVSKNTQGDGSCRQFQKLRKVKNKVQLVDTVSGG